MGVKLSKPMEDMVRGAEIHGVRVNGEVVRRGYIVAGRGNTVVALMARDICTAATAEHYGLHWLTDDGLEMRAELVYGNMSDADRATEDARINAREAAIEADNARLAEDHPMMSDMITVASATTLDIIDGSEAAEARMSARLADVLAAHPFPVAGDSELTHSTDDMPLDLEAQWRAGILADLETEDAREIAAEREEALAEVDFYPSPMEARDFDMMNADMERRDLVSELDRDPMIIHRTLTDDDIMIMTRKGILVSQAFMNMAYRIRAYNAQHRAAWKQMQEVMASMPTDPFAHADAMVVRGEMTFRQADKSKRILGQIIRPTVGPKRKPSKHR